VAADQPIDGDIDTQFRSALGRLGRELPLDAFAWLHHVQSAASRPDYRAHPPRRAASSVTLGWQVTVFLDGVEVSGEGDTAGAAVDDVLAEFAAARARTANDAPVKPPRIASPGTAERQADDDPHRAAAS
jgi:hypothetical protein